MLEWSELEKNHLSVAGFTEWYLLSYLVFPFGLRGLQTFASVRFGKAPEKDKAE